MNGWTSVERALEYLSRADSIPHRAESEAVLIEQLPEKVDRTQLLWLREIGFSDVDCYWK